MAAAKTVRQAQRGLADRLKEVIGDRSERQFARDLGVFQQNVNRYCHGQTPHFDFLVTVALKENVRLDWLVLGRGHMRSRHLRTVSHRSRQVAA